MTRRSYDQFCGLARALDLVGERWTLLLVRDLYLGPQRYSDLLTGLPGIGTGLLADRLKHLEAEGVVRRALLPPPAGVAVYELTDDGRELAEAMLPLAVWGARRLGPHEGDSLLRADWLFLSLRAQFKPDAAAGVHDTYEFRVDGQVLHVRIDDGTLDVRRGPAPQRPDVIVTTGVETLLDLGLGQVDPVQAVLDGTATIEGSAEALQRCVEILGPLTAATSPATAG